MYCYYCGQEISDDSEFCTFCGRSLRDNNQQQQQQQQYQQYENARVPEHEPSIPDYRRSRAEGENNKNIALLVCITVLVLVICILVAIIFISRSGQSEDNKTESRTTPIATQTVVSTPHPTQEADNETEQTFDRTTLYSSNYSYERMPDIHSSSPANDKESLELAELIRNFNDSWIEFINYSDMGVYQFLRAGTKPYGYAEDYEKKSLSQEYRLMDILDVRKTDDNYYVWTHEIIDEYDYDTGKEKRLEYHWVYRVVHDSNGYYIADYISDPTYK